jgi:hypothetical protein
MFASLVFFGLALPFSFEPHTFLYSLPVDPCSESFIQGAMLFLAFQFLVDARLHVEEDCPGELR